MMASIMTSTSEASNMPILANGIVASLLNTVPDTFISIISWGIIMGKPRMAMIAAFCCALAAIAARKVKTRLNVQPPRNTIPIKTAVFCTGKPRKRENRTILKKLIASISTELNRSFARTKF